MVAVPTTSSNIKNNYIMPKSEATAYLSSIKWFVFIPGMDCVLYEL